MIPSIPEETLGNEGLETEWLSSLILSGLPLPPEYTNLRINIAGLKFLEVAGDLDAYLSVIQKELVDKFGLLKDRPVEQYYYGTNPELYAGMQYLSQEIDRLVVVYGAAVTEKFLEQADKINESAQTMSYEDLGNAINTSAADTAYLHHLDQTQLQLRYMQGIATAILSAYGTAGFKVPKKSKVKVGITTDYKLFLDGLSTNLGDVCSNMQLGFTLGRALDSIISLMPKDDNLDPFVEDVCSNFLDVIIDPKSFYSKCKTDQIIDSDIGKLFFHSYPEFYDKFQDMFMDEVSEMDYQAVLDFRKCFGMEPDDSALTTLCSQYINLGFKPAQ